MRQGRAWKHSIWMIDAMKILIIFAVLGILYVLAVRGRTGHPGLAALRGWNYAHRGLHGNGVPENSLKAFRLAVEHGYGAEFDVHLLADGGLAVIHDSKLKRTTGAEGRVEDLTTAQLKEYRLEGTDECIPTFREVLDVFDGKTPLIIELKAEENAAALCDAVCRALEGYQGVYCLESFDPRCILWLKKHRPDLIRGQLAENSLRNPQSRLPWILKVILSFHLENFLTLPDFIAYDFPTRENLSNQICRRLWKVQGVVWTLRSQADHDTALKEGWIPIFEHYLP